jgi:hypothetical protein
VSVIYDPELVEELILIKKSLGKKKAPPGQVGLSFDNQQSVTPSEAEECILKVLDGNLNNNAMENL